MDYGWTGEVGKLGWFVNALQKFPARFKRDILNDFLKLPTKLPSRRTHINLPSWIMVTEVIQPGKNISPRHIAIL
ncbi:hypothetical protein M1437_01935 [Patescibacteria group bacterium]|nr:hypothetical protein [Patescibacteria group bacterium]